MKTKLFLMLLFVGSFAFAQVPTDQVAQYLFTNGSLVNVVDSGNGDLTGGAIPTSSSVEDRFGVANHAMDSNGVIREGYQLTGTNNDVTVSFWAKSSAPTGSDQTIFSVYDTSGDGFSLLLSQYNSFKARFTNAGTEVETWRTVNPFFDGEWHQITFVVSSFGGASAGYKYHAYIDGGLTAVVGDNVYNSPSDLLSSNATFKIPTGYAGTSAYFGDIDDIHIFDRALSVAEVEAMYSESCIPSQLTASNVQSNSVDLSWDSTSQQTAWDLSYTSAGGDPNTGTIISNIGASPYTLTGLNQLTDYDVYVRSTCNSTLSGWSNVASVTTGNTVFVDIDATGLNDGSSWANAYTDLNDALTSVPVGIALDIWIADGTYTPTTTDSNARTATYRLPSAVKLFGGFNGTETMLSQRDVTLNKTILSGDVLGNDNGILSLTEATRSDNLYHIISLRDNIADVLVDGITISDSNADTLGVNTGANANRVLYNTGGAIYVALLNNSDRVDVRFNNCIIENHSAYYGAVLGSYVQNTSSSVSYNLDFTNSKIRSNYSDESATMLFMGRPNAAISGQVTNCLFTDNRSRRSSSCIQISRVNGAATVAMVDVVNSTFTNNTGSSGKVIASSGAAELSTISNCIIYGNGSNTPLDFYTQPYIVVSNSIIEGGQEGGIDVDPLFISAIDFTLHPNSPAINAGDNSLIPAIITEDLAGDQRVFDTTVDIGAYEFNAACGEFMIVSLTASSTVATEATLNWLHPFDAGTTFEIVYVVSGMPISSGTVISNVTGNSQVLTGLSSNYYDVYLRADCSGTSSAYQLNTLGFKVPILVDRNATGANNGSSWANAYKSLQDALSNAIESDVIWVAGGTYKSSVSNRTESFDIVLENLSIYGGFAGTETQLSERVLGANETILSGDIQENDVNFSDFVSNYGNTSRNSDNSYTVINISATGNNLILDGLTISDAHNNLNATAQGGAIIKNKVVSELTLRNCTIKDNVSRNDNAGLLAEFDLNNTAATKGQLTVENCKFINNMSRWATGLYTQIKSNSNLDITITNSLFDGNISGNLNTTSATGISGSAGWFRMLGNNSNVNLDFSNNTLVNNIDNGTGQNMTASKHAVLGISKGSGVSGVFNVEAANNIFWDNKTTGNVATRSITDLSESPVNSVNVYNSIDEQNFNDSSLTSIANSSNQDPLFSNASAQDYTLTATSPAVDSGDNTYVFGATDLLGNQRIFNTTVDMGAYEYSSTLGVNTFELSKNEIKIYPNPTSSFLNIKMKNNLKQATVYSILGAKVLETKSSTINTSNLNTGMYLITIEDENGNVATKRFIKQ